jgi:response regulator NasT
MAHQDNGTLKPLRVMLVDENRGRLAILTQALKDAGHQVVAQLDGTENLLPQVSQVKPDIILIDLESPSRDTLESLRSMSQDQPKPIVMFAERSDQETTENAIRAGVSAYVVDGLNPDRLKPLVEVAIARFREFQALRQELAETRSKLAERKVIEKAKGLLMQKKQLNEQEAYQALRKMAMDRNQRLGEVAQNVIDVMELLG